MMPARITLATSASCQLTAISSCSTRISRGDILIQKVAGAVPLLGQFQGWVSEQSVLPVQQLGIEIFEQLEDQVLLGAEMIVDLAGGTPASAATSRVERPA